MCSAAFQSALEQGSSACSAESPYYVGGIADRAARAEDPAPSTFPARTPLGEPDFRALPALMTGPCPICGLDISTRACLNHAVGFFTRRRLWGYCVECGPFGGDRGVEVLWDSEIRIRPKPPMEPGFPLSMADAVAQWMAS